MENDTLFYGKRHVVLEKTIRCFVENNTSFYEKQAVILPETYNPNRSLDRYSEVCYEEDNFLSSFIFLLASCFSFVLVVARYAVELTANNLLNNQIKSIQDLMSDLGFNAAFFSLSSTVKKLRYLCTSIRPRGLAISHNL